MYMKCMFVCACMYRQIVQCVCKRDNIKHKTAVCHGGGEPIISCVIARSKELARDYLHLR